GRSAVAALAPKAEIAEEEERSPRVYAEIKAVESEYAGKVLTQKNNLIANAFVFAGLLLILAALGLMAWGGLTAFPTSAAPTAAEKVFGLVLLILGGVFFLSLITFFLISPSYLGNRYLLKVIKREFARRPKRVVESDDPEALFVEIVPKMNWG